MKVAFIEPFYGISHQQWIDGFAKNILEKNKITYDLYSQKPRFWKWRLLFSAEQLATEVNHSGNVYTHFICSSFLDLCLFKLLLSKENQKAKFILYFHENQLCYQHEDHSGRKNLNAEQSFGLIQYKSLIASDRVCFNSQFHKESFFKALKVIFKKMPDYRKMDFFHSAYEKSEVLYCGVEEVGTLKKQQKTEAAPVIVWNHRWEQDKNPEEFFNILKTLKDKNYAFQLKVLGESFQKSPEIFNWAKEFFHEEIVHWGYLPSREEYVKELFSGDVLLVSCLQENFGYSVMEAAAMGLSLVLPQRLVYPELYAQNAFFYSSLEEAEGCFLENLFVENKFNVERFSWASQEESYLRLLA